MEATRKSTRQIRRRKMSDEHEEDDEIISGNDEEQQEELTAPPRKRGRPPAKKDHDFGTEPSPDPDGLSKRGPQYIGSSSTKIKNISRADDDEEEQEPEENGIEQDETDPNLESMEGDSSEYQTTLERDLLQEPDAEQEEGVVGFTSESLSFDNVERLLLHADDIPKSKICTAVPSGRRAFLGNISYVIDLDALSTDNDIRIDMMGRWGTPSGRNRFYIYKDDGTPSRMFFKDGKPPPANVKYDVKIMRNFYRNSSSGNKLYKKIFKSSNSQGETLRYAVIAYEWAPGGPFHFDVGPQRSRAASSRGRATTAVQMARSQGREAAGGMRSFGGPPRINIRGGASSKQSRLFSNVSPKSAPSSSIQVVSDMDSINTTMTGATDYSSTMETTAGTGMSSLISPRRGLVATEMDPLLAQKRELIRQQSANAKLMNTVLMKTNKLLDKISRAPVLESLEALVSILSQTGQSSLDSAVMAEEGVMPEEGANVVVHDDGEVVQYQYS